MKLLIGRLYTSLWAFSFLWSAEHSCFGQAPKPAPPLDTYRKYALTHEGDVTRVARLFADEQRLGCSKCHSIDGRASKAGPDLFAAGDAFGRRDLVEAVLLPSATIAPGYGTVLVETKDGALHQGVLKQSTDLGLQLMGVDGKPVFLATADIREQRGSTVSLMPEGLHAGLTLKEFTDLVEYLASLKQSESTRVSNRGMPTSIPQLARPVIARPFVAQALTLPPAKVKTGLTAFHQVPGFSQVFLVLHQKGMIWRIEKSSQGEVKTVFTDLTGQVFSERGPNGLLNLAFHPNFRENRKYYLKYQVFEENKVATLIVEKLFAADFKGDSGVPPRRVMKIVSVAEDHSGGGLAFGPDGFLYVVMGDTGPHNDPNGHAQNLGLLLGKMMRIDVDRTEGDLAYAIPADNPFRGRVDARPEIWAYGLRNPWRFSFDRPTGDLWVADVGQDREEEVAIVRRGENHGWNVFEGFEPFSNQYRQEGRVFTPPLFAYRRKYGNSITGGYVYRADKASSFYGVYLCGDYTSKRIFGLTQENGVLKVARQIGTLPQALVSFGTDEAGQIYGVGFEGMIYHLDFAGARYDLELAPGDDGPGLIADGAQVEVLGDSYSFTEGPAVDRDGNVFFTDQPNDRIVKYDTSDRSFSDWLKPAGRSNGTYVDAAGNLLACADEKNELWSIAPDKKVTVMLGDLGGKLLNGPNDLWIRPDGNLYFTDPLYPRPYWKRDKVSQQPGQYVYYFDRVSKKLIPVATDLKQPNGIIGTPDGRTLYVADIGARKTYSYSIKPDGTLGSKTLFCDLGSDGMTLDAEGNVYLTGRGVTVFDKTGKQLTTIPIPEPWTANVTFAGKDRRLLFITASKKVYGVQMRVRGAY